MVAVVAVVQAARLAPLVDVDDLEALQERELTEAVRARLVRRLVLDGFFLAGCWAGAEVTGAGLAVTGAEATGVGIGVGVTGVVAGGAVETGVLAGGVVDTGVVVGGVVTGVGSEVVVPEPLHRPWAQHGSTTRSLLIGIPGPSMIQRLSGE